MNKVCKLLFVLLPLGVFFAVPGSAAASPAMQGVVVTGTVTDAQGEPMPGVNVVVQGTTVGVVSDIDGKYSVNVPDRNAVLLFSFVGYAAREVAVGDRNVIDVSLEESTSEIDEVVVVGYGTQKKINLTGAVQNVTAAELTRRNTSNTSVALQGMIPGVSVVQSSGQPGADGAAITIRGTGSFNSSTSPLVLIDGVEGDLNNIDLNAIESVSVLKDAASASIYGSRSSNGVILVTTKRAKDERVRVSYNGYAGLNRPTELPDAVDAVGYMEAMNTAVMNGGAEQPQYSQEVIDAYRAGVDNKTRFNTDWRELMIKDAAFLQNHSLSLSGGSKNISYFANAGYYYQDGQIDNNDYSRMTLRMNTDARITDWLSAGLDLNIRQSKARRPNQQDPGTLINKAFTFVPMYSGVNADGTWGVGQNNDNPVAVMKAGGVHTGVTPDMSIKGFVRLTPFDGFEALASYSSRRQEYKVDAFTRKYDVYENGTLAGTWPANGPAGQVATESWSQTNWNQFNAQASYEKTVARHYVRAFAGMQTEEYINRNVNTNRTGFDYPGFEEIKHGNLTSATNSSFHEERAMVSFFGRVNYTFADRYLLELNGRWDASSRFTADNRRGFFPSLSAGWRISEESFFEPLKSTVNHLKIRGSYGMLGNQELNSNYPYIASIAPGYGYRFDKVLGTGYAQTAMANELITWEKSSQMNLAFDAALFRSRLNLSFDYYIRKIDDMLQRLPVPGHVGLDPPFSNAGSMRNNGWDLSVGWRDKTGEVGWSIAANLSDVKNEVTDLYGAKYINPTNTVQEGLPIWAWYGYVSDGYFQNDGEITDAKAVYGGDKTKIFPGYVRYADIGGEEGTPDDKIDADYDMTMIGDPMPRYQFGLSLGADWKGFDVSVFFQGIGKKDILLTGYGARPFYVGRTIFTHQLDTWSKSNPNAEFPLLLLEGAAGGNMNNIVSDFWIRSGAYMRLKNVVIGYTLPARTLGALGVEHLRFYISGQNLFTISNAYKGYDPENAVDGGNFYPVMQTFTFGVDLRF